MISEDSILEALRHYAGIDAAQTGEESLRKDIRRAIKTCPQPHRLLDTDSPEWRALLDTALVPETWFFRNIEAFEAMVRWVTASWQPAHPGQCLEVLSLPCATGEEPYAIAMCLREAGLSPDQFKIRAGDLSETYVARARAASYGRNSFRTGFDEARFGKYFDDLGNGVRQVKLAIRESVELACMNLVNRAVPLPPSHLIFCRNALIYFSQETQLEVVAHLRAALSDDGILFLGPVEPPIALQCGFTPVKFPMAFACQKVESRPVGIIEKPIGRKQGTAQNARATAPRASSPAPKRSAPAKLPSARQTAVVPPVPAADSLAEARILADAGNEAAAAAMLDVLATTLEPTPEFFCLRGIVSEALGRGSLAEGYYRKALYLDPAHYETLTHLALLLDLAGRTTAASQLRRRATNLAL